MLIIYCVLISQQLTEIFLFLFVPIAIVLWFYYSMQSNQHMVSYSYMQLHQAKFTAFGYMACTFQEQDQNCESDSYSESLIIQLYRRAFVHKRIFSGEGRALKDKRVQLGMIRSRVHDKSALPTERWPGIKGGSSMICTLNY